MLRDADLMDDYRGAPGAVLGPPAGTLGAQASASLWRLPEIRRVFPDVRFVWTHRAGEVSVASYCSLAEAGQAPSLRPGISTGMRSGGCGSASCPTARSGLRHSARSRRRVPWSTSSTTTSPADPRATLHGVFDRLGMTWSDQDEANLAAATRRQGHTGHHCSLERYGPTPEQVRAAFGGTATGTVE
ncbi:hypothetical protein GCM10028784_05300 [Myceligenerans cantabricum]